MTWLQLRITVVREQADQFCELLSEAGAAAVSLEDAAHDPLYEPGPGETPLWPNTEIAGLFESKQLLESALQTMRAQTGLSTLPAHRIEELPARDWTLEWQARYEPVDCGNGLWICPEDYAVPAACATVVRMQPGLAFGTGTHPTTGLCLRWIGANNLLDKRVIDFGCGSGILGIAALKRGAMHVWAVDHDVQALGATSQNAQQNHVNERLETLASGQGLPKDSDVLLANILLNPLIELAHDFAGRLRAGGRLVLSGLLEEQAEMLWPAYEAWFEDESITTQDGWVCLSARRSG